MRHRRHASPWKGTLRLALLFALLIAVNIYFLFLRGGTSLPYLQRISEQRRALPALLSAPKAVPKAAAQVASAPPEPHLIVLDEGRMSTGTVGASDSFHSVLGREGVSPKVAAELVGALSKLFDPRNVRTGQTYTLRFDDEERLRNLEWRVSAHALFRVARRGDSWHSAREQGTFETRWAVLTGTGGSSLFDAIERAGEGRSLAAALIELLAWDTSFYLDSQPGDRFKILVEKQYLDGKFRGYGRILSAEYSGRLGPVHAIWFEPVPGSGAYYNEQGESVVKTLLKTPVKYARFPSNADRRRYQPTLHTEQAHLGVGYPAPAGTAVWAIAPGRVTFRGVRGGAHCVQIAHPGGMESVYLQLAKLARNLEVGDSVRQKQVIGYLGGTGGLSHLHFSVKMGGHFIDPLRLRPARSTPLPISQYGAFQTVMASYREALADAASRSSTSAQLGP